MSEGLNRDVCTPLAPDPEAELGPASPSRASSLCGMLSGGRVLRRGCVGRCNDWVSWATALFSPDCEKGVLVADPALIASGGGGRAGSTDV